MFECIVFFVHKYIFYFLETFPSPPRILKTMSHIIWYKPAWKMRAVGWLYYKTIFHPRILLCVCIIYFFSLQIHTDVYYCIIAGYAIGLLTVFISARNKNVYKIIIESREKLLACIIMGVYHIIIISSGVSVSMIEIFSD